jgi:hypothetical protein
MFLVRRRMIGAADHRQDRRGEPDRLGIRHAAVAHLGPADLEGADPGLDPPLGRVAVAHSRRRPCPSTRPAWAARNASISASIAGISIRLAPSRSTASGGSAVTPEPGLGRATTVSSSMHGVSSW